MKLFPQLSAIHAKGMLPDLSAAPIEVLRRDASVSSPFATYTPVGGVRVQEAAIRTLQQQVRDLAGASGYPTPQRRGAYAAFDAGCARLLLSAMQVVPSEAAKDGIWQFLCCVALPDIVRWRFHGDGDLTSGKRFMGGLRNALGRLWWRAYLLEGAEGLYAQLGLLDRLSEEELVQLQERPTLAGCRPLVRTTALTFLTIVEDGFSRRQELMRDAQKRIMRLASFVSFDALEPAQVTVLVTTIFAAAKAAVQDS